MRTLSPIFVGLCIAGALIAVLRLSKRYIQLHPLSRGQHSAIFALMSGVYGAFCIALWGQIESRIQAFVWFSNLVLSVMFAVASCGVASEWPGFRPESTPDDEIEDALYDEEVDEERGIFDL